MFLLNGLVAQFTDTNVTNNIQDNGATGGVLVAMATTVTFDNCNFLNNTGGLLNKNLLAGCRSSCMLAKASYRIEWSVYGCKHFAPPGLTNGGLQAQSVNTVNVTNSVFRANQGSASCVESVCLSVEKERQ